MGCSLMSRLISYLQEIGDLVTLATAICVLGGSDQVVRLISPCFKTCRHKIRSSEECEIFNKSSLDLDFYFERALLSYASMLSCWNAMLQAVEVRKSMSLRYFPASVSISNRMVPEKDTILDAWVPPPFNVRMNCSRCGKTSQLVDVANKIAQHSTNCARDDSVNNSNDAVNGTETVIWCQPCKDYALVCFICQLPVRGSGYFCSTCGHGGHSDHIKNWFDISSECAAGCGCRCAEIIGARGNSFIGTVSHQKGRSIEASKGFENVGDLGDFEFDYSNDSGGDNDEQSSTKNDLESEDDGSISNDSDYSAFERPKNNMASHSLSGGSITTLIYSTESDDENSRHSNISTSDSDSDFDLGVFENMIV